MKTDVHVPTRKKYLYLSLDFIMDFEEEEENLVLLLLDGNKRVGSKRTYWVRDIF